MNIIQITAFTRMILSLHNLCTTTVVEEWGEYIFFTYNHHARACTHSRLCVRSFLPEIPLRELYEILDRFANYQRIDSSEYMPFLPKHKQCSVSVLLNHKLEKYKRTG